MPLSHSAVQSDSSLCEQYVFTLLNILFIIKWLACEEISKWYKYKARLNLFCDLWISMMQNAHEI